MGELTLDRTDTASVEIILRDELARETRALGSIAPVVSHLLESSGQPLVSDEVVARLRGMLNSIAAQLLNANSNAHSLHRADNTAIDALVDELAQDNRLINHLYALSIEGELTLRLEHTMAVDPVLSPLVQELIASDQPAVAELAMATLAAQARFMQSQRRMEHSLTELPADLLSSALAALGRMGETTDTLKIDFDEARGRLGLLARLISSMQGGAVAALELEHAGLALFASALSAQTKQSRDHAVLSCHERQAARLALGLCASGLDEAAIERQFALIGPANIVPSQLVEISPEKAQQLLDANSEGAW